ncbi:MAG: outer membrane receptor for ferrienterochelin and colicins [Flavobacteriales bacterium]|jgi:outer membrane receptor for ferrienterochelin and colicins|tara:strand:+ start:321 stop:524 length:204 start_codon:yes stop_codon:yes gene_type:complete
MSSFNVCAQALQQLDSLVANKLEEVVITGQINPQSISNSIVEVKVITREDIERQAGDTTISKKLILN